MTDAPNKRHVRRYARLTGSTIKKWSRTALVMLVKEPSVDLLLQYWTGTVTDVAIPGPMAAGLAPEDCVRGLNTFSGREIGFGLLGPPSV